MWKDGEVGMSIQVNDFQWEPGKNDAEYIKLLKSSRDEWQKIAQKAITKLKTLSRAQEPRVMTLEEADKAPYVWLESDQGGLGVRRVEIDPEDSRTVYVMSFGLRTTIHEVRTFKRHFRCWSEKPSDELRKETPWTQINGL